MRREKRSIVEYVLVAATFLICLAGAAMIPMNQCPDENGRQLVTDWIVRNGTLPTGNEAEVMIPGWGFSYALRPYLASVIGAVFVLAARLVTDAAPVILAASRMGSVLSLTACCLLCLRMGHSLFLNRRSPVLFAMTVCWLPQAMFLGMYQNCDALGLAAVCGMLTCLTEGYANGWKPGTCAGMGVAMAVGLLSYYTVYPWILMTVLYGAAVILREPGIENRGRTLGRSATLIGGICLVLAGWFFVRNAVLHGGDPLGMASEEVSRNAARAAGVTLFEYQSARKEGLTLTGFLLEKGPEWVKTSIQSFIGLFGYMSLAMPRERYFAYCSLIAAGIVACILRRRREKAGARERIMLSLMLVSTAITVLLSLWQSYARDYEPQGRYMITAVLPLAFMMSWGTDGAEDRKGRTLGMILASGWAGLFLWTAADTMSRML